MITNQKKEFEQFLTEKRTKFDELESKINKAHIKREAEFLKQTKDMKKAGEVVFTGLKDGMIKATAEWAKQTNTKFAALQDWNSKKLKEANQE